MNIYQQWQDAKAREAEATAERREIEDQLVAQFNVPLTLDKTANFEADGYKIKVEGRINRRINADLLQEIAAENDLGAHLSSLFRWKPEINAAAWKAADEAITKPLLDAITATPGRPSFTISTKD
ncbi:hypothetical protein [Brevundimonas sp.]|jgi:hypothetical protein|uniref:DUF7173 family protein n=1 Tax=Brevundimonas sp. TaxID=1871086 RepID=UPI003783548F